VVEIESSDPWWDDLVYRINRRPAIVIVGPELLVADTDDSRPGRSLDEHAASELARALGLDGPDLRRTRDVVNAHIGRNGSRDKLETRFQQVYETLGPVPPTFRLLAELRQLSMFIAVTPDRLLLNEVNRVRHAGRQETLVGFNCVGSRTLDLPVAIEQLRTSAVFYPFGYVDRPNFAMTEEDMLECLFRLFQRADQFTNFFAALKTSDLIFVGCNYPDWLSRFWIRAMSGDLLTSGNRRSMYIVADTFSLTDQAHARFLQRTNVKLYDGCADDFVRRLHSSLSATAPAEAAGSSDHVVFVSYSSKTDGDAARRAIERLRGVGLSTWFDVDDIRSGQRTEAELRRSIESSLVFVPIISRAAIERDDYPFFRLEWEVALARAARERPTEPFIHPIFLDRIEPNHPDVPQEFWRRIGERIEYSLDGNISERFVLGLRDQVRAVQARAGIVR
jgi:hypothetical protein